MGAELGAVLAAQLIILFQRLQQLGDLHPLLLRPNKYSLANLIGSDFLEPPL